MVWRVWVVGWATATVDVLLLNTVVVVVPPPPLSWLLGHSKGTRLPSRAWPNTESVDTSTSSQMESSVSWTTSRPWMQLDEQPSPFVKSWLVQPLISLLYANIQLMDTCVEVMGWKLKSERAEVVEAMRTRSVNRGRRSLSCRPIAEDS